jgi:signal transduction histidine kinase
MRIRTRIIVILISVFIGLILAFSFFIYFFVSRYSFTDFFKRLEIRSYTTAKIEFEKEGESELIKNFKGDYLEPLMDEKHYILKVDNTLALDSLAKEYKLNQAFLAEINANGVGSYRRGSLFYSGIIYKVDSQNYMVITSAVNYYYSHHMDYFRKLLISAILIATAIVVVISLWVSKRLIDPVKQIAIKMNSIGTDNLYVRLEGNESDDELGELSRTFNSMLDRLETSFETQKNFISNASHELNTPLTSIIGEADIALARERSSEEYKEAIANMLEEAEKLDKKTKALLYLAQTGYSNKQLTFDKVRMDQLLFDVRETINRIIPGNKILIDLQMLPESPEKLKVKGNEHLLHLALSNLLINACKYSNNKDVFVSIGVSATHIIIVIKDQGIGIPDTELPYIYDPFFRASNTSNFEGYGIGLPLTRNIIKIHGGELLVTSENEQGTWVEVRLPLGGYTL